MKGLLLVVVDPTKTLGLEGDESARQTNINPVQDLLLTEMAKMMFLHCIQNNRMHDERNGKANDVINHY